MSLDMKPLINVWDKRSIIKANEINSPYKLFVKKNNVTSWLKVVYQKRTFNIKPFVWEVIYFFQFHISLQLCLSKNTLNKTNSALFTLGVIIQYTQK